MIQEDDARQAALALFNAWHTLLMLFGFSPALSAWPVVLGVIEHELSREAVLMALPAGARALVELHVEIPRCWRCGSRLVRDIEVLARLCTDCSCEFAMDAEGEVGDVD